MTGREGQFWSCRRPSNTHIGWPLIPSHTHDLCPFFSRKHSNASPIKSNLKPWTNEQEVKKKKKKKQKYIFFNLYIQYIVIIGTAVVIVYYIFITNFSSFMVGWSAGERSYKIIINNFVLTLSAGNKSVCVRMQNTWITYYFIHFKDVSFLKNFQFCFERMSYELAFHR